MNKIVLFIALMVIVGILFPLTVLASGVPFKVDPIWDRSSLSFTEGCTADCSVATAKVCNGADSGNKLTSTVWELYFATTGNPKDGTIVGSGIVPPLDAGECYTITAPTDEDGNYMFKAYQAAGHPGVGELWSEQCTIGQCEEDPEEPQECTDECYVVRYENRLVDQQCQIVEVSRESCSD